MHIVLEKLCATALLEDERIAMSVMQDRGWTMAQLGASSTAIIAVPVPSLTDAEEARCMARIDHTIKVGEGWMRIAAYGAWFIALLPFMFIPHHFLWLLLASMVGSVATQQFLRLVTRHFVRESEEGPPR